MTGAQHCGSLSVHGEHDGCLGVQSVPGTTNIVIPGWDGAEPAGVSDKARAAGLAALEADKDWHKPDSMGVWRANYTRAVELVLNAAAPLMGASPVASREMVEQVVRRVYIDGGASIPVAQEGAADIVSALLAAGVFREAE